MANLPDVDVGCTLECINIQLCLIFFALRRIANVIEARRKRD